MFVDSVRQFFVRQAIPPSRIVVAVSGGGDSTALLLALAELRAEGFEVVAAHVNHHLRGADSEADEQFVRDCCTILGVELHVADGTLDPLAVKMRGVEAAAREIRFDRLQQMRAAAGARYIATAHHRDDQAETVLMRLISGGGLGALRGIQPRRDDGIIRPLLSSSRADVEAFLAEREIVARFDRSNSDLRFLRNRVRAMLRDLDPAAATHLAALADEAARQWPHLERVIDMAEAASVQITSDETRFVSWPDDLWLRQALLHRHILRLDPDARDVSAADLKRVATGVGQTKRISVTRSLELIRRSEILILRRRPLAIAAFEYPARLGEATLIPELSLVAHVARLPAGSPAPRTDTPMRQQFALPCGADPQFVFRNRRDGDRLQPLGMAGSRKLKELLIDRKIPRERRDAIPLLIWNGDIVWVAGVEISERFKIDGAPERENYEVWLDPEPERLAAKPPC